ncbi:MAG: hypothetical protein Q8R32_00425, partial [bacterium]|nr:hypothetical protein [bacterium]
LVVVPSPTGAATTSPGAAVRPPEARAREAFLIAELRDPKTWETLFLAEDGAVRAIALPSSVARAVLPVTDGTRVYAYVTGSREPDFAKATSGRQAAGDRDARIAAFSFAGQEEETVTDSTPLVEPRGLFASPNGQFLAFFLDDRQSDGTELWTYDTVTRAKRVSVERLSRPTVDGPYFAFDGSFLLRSGDQLLAGSPRRTGVDILDMPFRGAAVRWDAGVARSPDGQRIVLVEETGDERTTVTHVREYGVHDAGSRIRFSIARDSVRILGWTDHDELLLVSDSRRRGGEQFGRPVLHILRGDQEVSRDLGGGGTTPALAGNGTAIGFLRLDAEQTSVSVQELAQAAPRVMATIPDASLSGTAASGGSPTPRASSGPSPAQRSFRLVQMLRIGMESAEMAPASASVASSVLLPYVVKNIQTLTDAPAGEPATPERIWMLAAPNALYVDYRIGSTLWRRLIQVQARNGTVVGASVLGIYAPVGGEWVLAKGEGVADPTPVHLFEYEADVRQWFEKPVVQYAVP